ncbi:MAG: NUDIX hydrolase [Anaerolineales bacterium]|nr:MAG: NUDIX hydrolase [Anaerolineales bacterium]
MTRVQGIIVRDRRILMAKHRYEGRVWWCLPGGSMAQDETPEEAVIRELEEECRVDAKVIQRISTLELKDGEQSITFLMDIGKQEPELGHDPEFEFDNQPLIDLKWLSLEEIPERDRVFLWASGLLVVDHFADEVQDWGDDISYPGRSG